MSEYFCISVMFLDGRFHGRGDGGEPEWPPSPLRLLQAIVAANSRGSDSHSDLDRILALLEQQEPPIIFAPEAVHETPYCLSVPNNAMDIIGRAWSRGVYFGTGDANPATHRTMKTVRPVRMLKGDTIHYVWKLGDVVPLSEEVLHVLSEAAGRIIALGWGIDLVIGRAGRISSKQLQALSGEQWHPTVSTFSHSLRVPVPGTVTALRKRYREFTQRIGPNGFVPVSPLTQYRVAGYRRPTDDLSRPTAVFELRHDDDSFCLYAQSKLIHIAGMVRHIARDLMTQSPPSNVDDDWVEWYVVGHRKAPQGHHRQLAYLPLLSVGHHDADQLVRRVMIVAPVGDEAWLDHLAQRLNGRRLEPEHGNEFGTKGTPSLIRVHNDNVARWYLEPATTWASVTPVILPGFDDRKPAKTRQLIEKALRQSGIEQPCTFEWSSVSRFRKSFTAHTHNITKRPRTYIRPDHLQNKSAVHLTLTFEDGVKVPGPIVVGAGRYCGFGLLASTSELREPK